MPEGCGVKGTAVSKIPEEVERNIKRTRQPKNEKRPKSRLKRNNAYESSCRYTVLDFGRNCIACVRVWGRVRMQRMTAFVHGA